MSVNFLITLPNHDDTTHYLSAWGKEIIKTAKNSNLKVFDLQGEKANKKEFESKIKNFSPKLIMLNGHGSKNIVTGHKNEILLKAGENEELLKSKIVYALSCSSAKILGLKSVKKGALNYTGYMDDFIFMYEPNLFSRPILDKTANLFLSPSNVFIESLIKGNKVRDSFERSRKAMEKNFKKSLSTSEIDPTISRFLWWNLRNFSSQGDMEVSI
jgi:hypothetical protein